MTPSVDENKLNERLGDLLCGKMRKVAKIWLLSKIFKEEPKMACLSTNLLFAFKIINPIQTFLLKSRIFVEIKKIKEIDTF